MKIFEIINTKLNRTPENPTWYDDEDKSKVMGSGAFSYVTKSDDDQDVGQVDVKSGWRVGYTMDELKRDAKFIWIMHTLKLAKEGNPYVPKVYDINLKNYRTYKDMNGNDIKKYRPEYKMKQYFRVDGTKVHSDTKGWNYSKIDSDGILSMARDISESLYRHVFETMPYSKNPGAVWEMLIYGVRTGIIEKEIFKDVNKNFLEVSRLITKLALKYNFNFDLHNNNFMIDTTPSGLKLVVIDPLS